VSAIHIEEGLILHLYFDEKDKKIEIGSITNSVGNQI
jgi:hypothetical protein